MVGEEGAFAKENIKITYLATQDFVARSFAVCLWIGAATAEEKQRLRPDLREFAPAYTGSA